MKYKVGDKVRIKSLDWYNENKDKDGNIFFPLSTMTKAKSEWCGKVMTILSAHVDFYRMEEMGLTAINYWTDEMIEGLAEEEMPLDKAGQITDFEYEGLAYTLPDGYQFVDDNGNVINATKIVLEKKKKEYPKTYEECYKIMGVKLSDCYIQGYKSPLLEDLQELLICRDTYWKLYGEEMGLGKSWEPDFSSHEEKFSISVFDRRVVCIVNQYDNIILTFPTREMRDAFYENFKELIEQCKELL